MKSKYTFNEIEEFLDKCNAPGIKILNGTSKQFLKADGSLDTKEYLSTTGGTIKGAGANFLIIDRTDGNPYIRFDNKGQYLGRIGFTTDYKPIVHLIDNNTYEIITSAGGTITSSDFAPLVIKRNDTNGVAVRLENKNGLLGNIGIAPNASGAYPFFGDGTTNYTLYHTGNFNPADYQEKNTGVEGGNGYVRIPTSSGGGAFIFYSGNYKWSITNEGWTGSFYLLHAGNYSEYALPLTGGTITVENIGDFNVYNKKQNLSAVHFYALVNNVRTDIGYLGVSAVEGPVYLSSGGKQYALLHAGNFANLIGDTYLKTTGGTITGEQTTILTLTGAKDNQYALLYFKTGDTFRGNVGWGHDRGMSLYNVASNATLGIKDDGTPHYNNNTLLHSGNVGEYALKTDGSNAMNAPLHLYYSAIDKYDGTFVCQSNLAGGAPFDYASVVNIEDERFSSMQLAWYRNLGKPMLSFRLSENGTFSAWKTIAFTDSDITGNAATANGFARAFINVANADLNTALEQGGIASDYNIHMSKHWQNAPDGALYGGVIQFFTDNRLDAQLLWDINHGNYDDTTRSLWWRARDDRGFSNAKWHQIAFTDSNVASAYRLLTKDNKYMVYLSDAGNLIVGDNIATGATHIIGNNVILRYGTSATNGLILNSSGNVTIGASDLASTCKLAVTGDVALLNPSSTLNASSSKLLFHSAHDNISGPSIQGIHAGVGYGAKHLVFNQHDTNGYTEYEAMRLTYDGKLLIGTTTDNGAKLNVHGGLFVNKYLDSGNKSGAYVVINKGDNYFGIGGSASGSYKMSFGTTSDAIGTWKNEIMTFLDNGNVGIGTTDPQYRLDILGDLCVNRNNHTSSNTTFRINCADNKVNLYAEDLDDATCNMFFYVEGKEGMRINSAGNVLMGYGYDNGSDAKLQVAGGASVSSLAVTGTSTFGGQSTFNAGITVPSGQSITFVDANGNNHVVSWDDTAGGLKIDDKIITVN